MRTHKPRTLTKRLAAIAIALTLAVGLTITVAAPSEAATTRPGAGFGQVDLVLSGYDQNAVIANGNYWNGLWAATVICWNSGVAGAVLSIGVCQSMVQTCALRAHFQGRIAGMTATWWPYPNWWCWSY